MNFTQQISPKYQLMDLYATTSVPCEYEREEKIPFRLFLDTNFVCYPKDGCPLTRTGNCLLPIQSLLFMNDVFRITVLPLHLEELKQWKAIERKGGGLFSRSVAFNLNEETVP